RNQPHRQQDPGRNDHEIVQVAENRDEIGNQINRAERVRRDANRNHLRIPRNARIAGGDPDRNRIAFDVPRPLPRALQHAPSTLTRLTTWPGWESNPDGAFAPANFKSAASTGSATRPDSIIRRTS